MQGTQPAAYAQPVDLGDGLEPVVLTRTLDFEAWPRFSGGLLEWYMPVFPGSLLRAIAGLVLLIGFTAIFTMIERAFGGPTMWTGAVLVLIAAGCFVIVARRKKSGQPRVGTGRVVSIEVRRPEPTARLRVIGDRLQVAEVVGHLPPSDEMREPVFIECPGVYAFADRIEDLSAAMRRVVPPPRVSKRLPWLENVVRAICGLVLFAALFAASQLAPGMRMGVWGVLVSGWCAWMLVASFNPVTIRVMPGRVDVFQTRLFRRSRITQTTFDLSRSRVTLDVNRGVVRVEDPARASWPGLYVMIANGAGRRQSLADFLHAARTRQVAPQVPAGQLLA